ncbi:hypothetical protein [Aphanothece hegewaldii]|uniref:hypothetical protein n=1 Tax=Aphanothece hegewaldii TaxID=1521625 RepID=UPI001C639A87|nr:hypothetical protein [Aphanothece hegewaldii]
MPETREWFISNIEQLRERSTTTPVREGIRYTTVGRLVPIQTVLRQVKEVKQYKL